MPTSVCFRRVTNLGKSWRNADIFKEDKLKKVCINMQLHLQSSFKILTIGGIRFISNQSKLQQHLKHSKTL